MHSGRVKFHIKRPWGNEATAIFAKARVNKKSVKFYIGKSILPELWDSNVGNVTTNASLIREWKRHEPQIKTILDNINTRIGLVRSSLVSYVNLKEQAGESFTHDDLKAYLNEKIGVQRSTTPSERVLSFIERFVLEIESGARLTKDNTVYKLGTVKNYQGFLVQFRAFEAKNNKHYKFKDIDRRFYDTFISFFNEKNSSLNTVGRYVKSLKVVMRAARQEGLHENADFMEFHVPTTKVDSIYLNEDEIRAMLELDLSDQPNYEQARDIFVIGCYTALRYSDLARLGKEHESISNGHRVIKIINRKTNKQTIIPLHPIVKSVLEKYDYQLPRTHEQKVNRYIKEVGRMAGLNDLIEVSEIRGGAQTFHLKPKYELIMTHTARRSAATNMFLNGVPPLMIMKITGHSTEKDFMKYIRIDSEKAAELLATHSFFL